jgi:hypothetical protein
VAARLTREGRLQRLVDDTRKRVDREGDSTPNLKQSPNSYLRTLVQQAGYEKRSAKLLEELDESLDAAGIGTHPNLRDPSIGPETRIYFFDLKRPIPKFQQPRQRFAEEKELSRFLAMNWAALPYIKKAGLRFRGREVRFDNSAIIDLLAVDKKTDELVGFELKVSDGDGRLFDQAARYMSCLVRQAKKEGRSGARLIIVTGQPNPELAARVQELADKYGVRTDWLLYNVSIDLSSADT